MTERYISDASQIAAIELAIDIAHRRRNLTPRETELHVAQLESIRQRILAAQKARREKDGQRQ